MIREARISDAESVAGLWNTMIRDTDFTFTTIQKTSEDVGQIIAERPAAFLIAEKERRLAGFFTFGPFRPGPGYRATAEHTIMVVPEAVGSGLAMQLQEDGERAALVAGVHVLIAAISVTNVRALQFHTARGFSEVARMPQVGRKNDTWLDLVLMQKILQPTP